MLAKHRTARWTKMAGWIIMPLLLVPVGGLAMYWAANLGLVPGLTPPITVIKPGVILENFSELRHFAESAGAHLRSLQTDALTQLRRKAPSTPTVVEVPPFQAPPTASLPSVAKNTSDSAQTFSATSSAVTPPTKSTKSDKKQIKAKDKSVQSKTRTADAKAKAASQQSTQIARTAAGVAPALSAATTTAAQPSKTEINPAGTTSGKTPSAPPTPAILLAAPVQAKFAGTLAATTSCKTEPRSEMIYAVTTPAQCPDPQTKSKPDQADRASGATLAAMISRAVNPLATGTALANSETLSTNATQMTPGGKISPEPAQTLDQEPFPAGFPQGSLGQMAKLRAELEQLKLQVHIEEVRQRLNQLKGQTGPPPPAPSLEFPPIGLPGPATAPEVGSPRSALRLLSIQSLNGKYTATLGTDAGPRVVRTNETVDGYRVVSISRNSVVINRGKGNEMLSIYE